jgi:hypothetical protein
MENKEKIRQKQNRRNALDKAASLIDDASQIILREQGFTLESQLDYRDRDLVSMLNALAIVVSNTGI